MKKYHAVIYSTSEWFCHAKYEGVVKSKTKPRDESIVSTELEDVDRLFFDTKKEAMEFCEYIEFKNKRLYP